MRTFAVWCLAPLLFADVAVALPQGGQAIKATVSTVDMRHRSALTAASTSRHEME